MRELVSCPWAEIKPESYEHFNWWSEFKSLGILPFGGNDLMEQPGFVYEAISFVQRIYDETSANDARKHQSEMQKQIEKLRQQGKSRG